MGQYDSSHHNTAICLPGSMWLQKLLEKLLFISYSDLKQNSITYELLLSFRDKAKHYLSLQFCIYLAVANFLSLGSHQSFYFLLNQKFYAISFEQMGHWYIFFHIGCHITTAFLTQPFQLPIFASLILINTPSQILQRIA